MRVVLLLVMAIAFVAATEVESEVDATAEVDSEVDSEMDESNPVGRNKRTTKPYVDPHWYHRDEETNTDLYALKLCCTTYRAIDANGHAYATCNQKFYWTCVSEKRCEYTLPRRIPPTPFSKHVACPIFSRKTHSGFSGPCLAECSREELSPELQNEGTTHSAPTPHTPHPTPHSTTTQHHLMPHSTTPPPPPPHH